MTQHEMVRKFTVEIPGNTAINQFAIEEARYRFRRETAQEPDEICLSPADRNRLMMDESMRYELTPLTFHGMKIVVDPELKDNEWKLIKTEAKTYAIE